MLRETRIRAVVLTVRYGVRASYYDDWVDAFGSSPHFTMAAFNLFSRAERRAAIRAVRDAELVVALHPCSADTLRYIDPLRAALKDRRGRLLVLVGNEYNLPWIRLADKREFLRDVGADWVGTQLPLEAGEWLYRDTGAAVLAVPHAANERVFRRDKPAETRAIDLGARSFRYPVYLGDDQRNRVYDLFARLGPAAGLRVDIANDRRLDRTEWAVFLNDCRGTIGSEAGTWYLERDDRTALAIREFLRERSGGPVIEADGWLHAAVRRLPYGVKAGLRALQRRSPLRHEAFEADEDDFAEVQAKFFAGQPRCPAYSKCISSRHFEAAATGTCQLLIRGRYNDVLIPDEHFISLQSDLADAPQALARFLDPTERERVAAAAHDLVHDAHTYRHRLAALHAAVSAGPPFRAD
ncbi:MAG: glycosyltransferase [Alphaproteobacteria bacterium]